MIRFLTGAAGLLAVAACVAAPITLALNERRQTRNFHVVREGVLYRSAQMTLPGLKRVAHDHHVRTVISLREGVAAADLAEEAFCRKEGIRFVRLLPRSWDGGAGNAEVDDNVRAFLEVMRDPANHPVLIHCFAGIHRTGSYCAVYRMEFEGWGNDHAINELKTHGYDNFDNERDIRGWLEGYRKGRLDEALAPKHRADTPQAEPVPKVSRAEERGRTSAAQIKPGMTRAEVDALVGG